MYPVCPYPLLSWKQGRIRAAQSTAGLVTFHVKDQRSQVGGITHT